MSDVQIDTTEFDLTGTHYDIGMTIGRASLPFAVPSWWPAPPPLEFALACAREIAALHSPLVDEFHGYADGQQLDYHEMLRIICRQRLGGRAVIPATAPVPDSDIPVVPERGGCISFAWRASNGHVLVGRNYDFYPIQRIRQRVRLRPEGTRPSVGMRGSVPGGRYDGVNDAGLFVFLHVVLADETRSPRPGVPFHLIPRILLETCGTVREALDLITMMPHLHSFNYLLADHTSFAAVECHADRLRIIYPEGDVLAVGNFYRHPDMAPFQRNRRQPVSRRRVAMLESGEWTADDPWQTTLGLLQDHEAPVCGHDGGHTTLWSALADLTDHRVQYAAGAPCCTPFVNVSWPA